MDMNQVKYKKEWESYLKAFFYNREDINKAAKLLLRFYSERSKTLNGEEPKEKITEVEDFGAKGFVLFYSEQRYFQNRYYR